MSVMNDIEYGFKDKNGKNIIYDKEKWNIFLICIYIKDPSIILSVQIFIAIFLLIKK